MTVTASIPSTVKIPQQKRSRAKFNAMLEAAERLFAEQGIPQTSVQQIVETAGVSIGAFYQRFENKDALIHTIFYMIENELDLLQDILAPSAERSLEETVQLYISSNLKIYQDKRGVTLALLLAVQENPSIREYVTRLRQKIQKTFTEALTPYKSEIGNKRFKTAVAMSMRLMYSYFDQYIIWEGHEPTEAILKHETSNKEFVKVILAYLQNN